MWKNHFFKNCKIYNNNFEVMDDHIIRSKNPYTNVWEIVGISYTEEIRELFVEMKKKYKTYAKLIQNFEKDDKFQEWMHFGNYYLTYIVNMPGKFFR